MSAEHLLVAAFGAGVIEGAAMMLYRGNKAHHSISSNNPTFNRPSVFSVIIPSTIYGSLALPLSLVGASPSLSLVSSLYPFSLAHNYPAPQESVHVSAGKASYAQKVDSSDEMATPVSREHLMKTRLGQTSEEGGTHQMKTAGDSVKSNVSEQEERSALIQSIRERNRRTAAAIRESRKKEKHLVQPEESKYLAASVQETSSSPSSSMRATGTSVTTGFGRYLSTLDGKPLQSQLAEGMRRSRIILVTAALACGLVSHQILGAEEEEKMKESQKMERLQGRNIKDVNRFVRSGSSVAIRLVGQDYSRLERAFLQDAYRSELSCFVNNFSEEKFDSDGNIVTLPVLFETRQSIADTQSQRLQLISELVDKNETSNKGLSSLWAYWNMGLSSGDWDKIPVSPDWLFRKGQMKTGEKPQEPGSEPQLLIEADTSPPLATTLNHENFPFQRSLPVIFPAPERREKPSSSEDGTRFSLKNALMASQALCNSARSKDVVQHRDLDYCKRVFILAASERGVEESPTNCIYIDSASAIAYAVSLVLESIATTISSSPAEAAVSVSEEQLNAGDEGTSLVSAEIEQTPDASFSNEEAHDTLSFFDQVGEKIRLVVNAALHLGSSETSTEVYEDNRSKTLHVVSSHRSLARFLDERMKSGGWVMDWESPASFTVPDTGVIFICCDTDEATCDAVLSCLHSVQQKSCRVLALVDDSSSKARLESLADLTLTDDRRCLVVLSVAEIHAHLFALVRTLLQRKMDCAEAQKEVDKLLNLS